MRPAHLVALDAAIIRGILDLFEREAEPVTSHLIQMTQHISQDSAIRILGLLQNAGVIERTVKEADILGVSQRVPCPGWQLTAAAKRGEIPGAEDLARGMSA